MTVGEGPVIDDSDEVLRRQVVTNWTKTDGSPMFVAFYPTEKDGRFLSTDRGYVEPKQSFDDYKDRAGAAPDATWPIVMSDVLEVNMKLASAANFVELTAVHDGGSDGLHDSHASVIFPPHAPSKNALRKVYERAGKELRTRAMDRGHLYKP